MPTNQPTNPEASGEKTKSSRDTILNYIKQEIESVVKFHTQSEDENSWNLDEIYEVMDTIFPVPLEVRIKLEEIRETKLNTQLARNKDANDNTTRGKLISYLYDLALKKYEELESRINHDQNIKSQIQNNQEPMRLIEKSLLLRSIDMFWIEHIDAMDHMRQGIGLRGYGQKDPLVEYKKEAYRMFQELLANIRRQVVYSIYKVGLALQSTGALEDPSALLRAGLSTRARSDTISSSGLAKQGATSSSVQISSKSTKKKIGRNDPCPCGSGKKYKKCHGA